MSPADRLRLLSPLLLLVLAPGCQGRSDGAPPEACQDLTPQHGASPQQPALFPYELEVEPKAVHPGGKVTLTIRPTRSDTAPIKGFFVQARNAQSAAPGPPLGKFVEIDQQHKAVDCSGPAAGVTHSSSGPKQLVSVTWMAPGGLESDILFLVSVAQEYSTFWAGIRSGTVTLLKEPTPEPEPAAEPEPEPTGHDDDDDDDDDDSSAGPVRAGVALLLFPLVVVVQQRLQ